jgi:actin beta/gamma 1
MQGFCTKVSSDNLAQTWFRPLTQIDNLSAFSCVEQLNLKLYKLTKIPIGGSDKRFRLSQFTQFWPVAEAMTAKKVGNCMREDFAIFMDNGSSLTKAGNHDHYQPRSVFATCVGVPLPTSNLESDYYFGDAALERKDQLQVCYPVKRGIITDCDQIAKLWEHTFYHELRMPPEDRPVMLTEPICNPKYMREKMVEILCETFYPQAFYLVDTSKLNLLHKGFTTGVSVEIGGGIASVVPFYEGYSIRPAAETIPLAGQDLTTHLQNELHKRGHQVSDQEAEQIKISKCYVAEKGHLESLNSNIVQSYTCSNGQQITLGNELFMCPEAIFQPSLLGLEVPGLHELVYQSIMKCDSGIREYLFTNICIGGGSSDFPGFQDRLQREIEYLVPSDMRVKVHGGPSNRNTVWEGASRFCDDANWIPHREYLDSGSYIVHRMCY